MYDKSSSAREETMDQWRQLLREGIPVTSVVDRFEKTLIAEVVERNTSATEAARELNITRQALNYKLAKFGLQIKK